MKDKKNHSSNIRLGQRFRKLLTTPITISFVNAVGPVGESIAIAKRLERETSLRRDQRQVLTTSICNDVKRGNTKQVVRGLGRLDQIDSELELLGSIHQTSESTLHQRHSFVFSSAMLLESFRLCVAKPEEGMHFILGVDLDGSLVGTQIVSFPYASRSIAGASGVHEATHAIAIQAHEFGHRIIAIIHSHPGSGKGANHPSHVDMKTHETWEKTHDIVGGIWSRDGYLRFFSADKVFDARVIGSRIQRIEDHVWKIEETSDVEM